MNYRNIWTLLLATLALSLGVHGQNQAPRILNSFTDQIMDQGGPTMELDLTDFFEDPDVTGPAIQLDMIYSGKTEPIYLALFWEDTPLTAQNFVDYVEAGRFAQNLIHRSVPGFVIQGGGFRFAPNLIIEDIPAFSEIQNEPGISNTRGTVAMAKRGGAPNSATSQWFINMSNNAFELDNDNGGFTAFARVLGDGMSIADEIANIPVYNTTSALGGAFAQLPLTAFNLERSSFVETNAFLVDPLRFAARSSNSNIVTVSLDDSGKLQLTPSDDTAGEATITVEASDLEGEKREATFTVTVLSNIETYDTWRTNQAFPDETSGLIEADPDFDGWNNLLEYTFGSNPLTGTSRKHFVRTLPNGSVQLTLREDVSSLVLLQTSIDLAAWTTIWRSTEGTNSPAVTAIIKENNLQTITVRPNPFGLDLVPRYWQVLVSEGDN